MIKVLQVLTDTNFGGAGMWLLNYLKSYNRNKYDVTVALPEHSVLKHRVLKLDVKVVEVKGIADCSYSKQGTAEFVKLFSELKPDIIHTHSSLSARIAAKKLKIKTINTRHCLEEKKSFPKNIIYGIINNYLSDGVIGVSKAVVENLIQDGIKKDKVHLVYNGIFPLKEISSEEKSAVREKYGFSNENVVVGIIARLEPVKGHEVFINAAKKALEKNDNLRFLIIGTGSLEKTLKAKVKELNLEKRIIFTGYISNVNDITNILDIDVLTSKREALSLSLIEGMSIKKPVITTDAGGTKEVVINNINGFTVKNGDYEALSERILMLASNEELRLQMGKEGAKFAGEIFSAKVMAEKIDGIYENVLK